MKKIAIISLCVAALTGMTSCATIDTEETARPIAISPITGLRTKAAIDGAVALPATRTLKVSAYYNAPAAGRSGNYFSNVTFAHDGEDAWKAVDPKYWPAVGTLDIFAYSMDIGGNGTPAYLSNVSQGVTAITVPDNRDVQSDIVFGRVAGQQYASTGTPMVMDHAQALLVFAASNSFDYNSVTNEGIEITAITLDSTFFSGTLSINMNNAAGSRCSWGALGSRDTKNLPGVSSYQVPSAMMDISQAGNHMGIGGAGILVPEQTETGFTIHYNLHNGKGNDGTTDVTNYNLQYRYVPDEPMNWAEGKKYVYYIYFTMREIIVSPVVMDWSEHDGESGGLSGYPIISW